MDAMTIAALSMQDDMQRLNTISQNLANVATSGYKRQFVQSQDFASLLGSTQLSGHSRLASQIDPNSLARSSVPAALDMRAGNLRASANVLDVVVEGEGFFEVSTAQGPAFMRQASLRADPGGRLLTQQGHAIAGLRADVRPGAGDISFSPQGEVRQGERSIGQIRLLRFNQANLLQSLGHGLFAQGGASIADGHPGNLRSGFQEASNVNSAQEMVQLTETVRHFESMQKAMQGYGEVYAQTLRKLGEF